MTTINRNFVVRQGIDVTTTANVVGATTLANTLSVTGNTTLSNTLTVTGAATFSNTITTSGLVNASSLAVVGTTNLNGAVILGDASADNISVMGSVNTNVIPVAGNTVTLGNTTQRWGTVWAGNVNVTTTTSVGNLTVSGTASFNGPTILGDAAGDNIAFTGSVNTNITPIAGNTLSLGSTTQRWSTVWANNINATTNVDAVGITARDLTLTGNLTVSGTTTYINTTSLAIGDAIFVLNADLANVTAPTENAGFEINRGAAANVSFLWDETNDRWDIGSNAIFDQTVTITGAATLSNTLSVTGAANVLSTLGVTGVTTLANTLSVTGAANVLSTFGATGAATLANTLTVTGLGSLNGGLNTTTANASTGVNVGANVVLTASRVTVGNSTVNSYITSSAIETDGTLAVLGATTLSNTLSVTGAANVLSTLGVSGAANLLSTLGVTGATTLGNTLSVTGAANALSTFGVTGATTLGNTLRVTGAANVLSTLGVTGAATLANTLNVTGETVISNNVSIVGTANVTTGININNTVSLNSSRISIGNSTVNSAITATAIDTDGTLAVLGSTTLSNTLSVAGLSSLNADVNVTGTANASVAVNVGANVNLTTSRINVGNSTVNSTITSAAIDTDGTLGVLGATTLSNTLTVAGLSSLDAGLNTTTANASSGINVGANVNINLSRINIGNTTVNTFISATSIDTDGTLAALGAATLSNTLLVTGLSSLNGGLNTTTANASTGVNVGANVVLTTSRITVGNSIINVAVSSAGINTSGYVNAASIVIGGKFTANTTQVTIAANTPISSNGSVGTAGRVLISAGANVSPYWGIPSTNLPIINDTTTDGTRYLTFTPGITGNVSALYVASTDLTFNPSSGTLSAVVFASTSDARAKENVETIENASDIVSNLRGVSFTRKLNNAKDYGVIAQEVELILPEIVTTDENGWKKVSYDSIIGVLIEAIKDQHNQINNLKSIVNSLTDK